MERIQEATIAFEVPETQEDMLEGLCFDRQGNLYFVGAVSGLLFKADVDTGEVKTIFTAPEGYGPTAIKIHQDGRLFVTCPGDLKKERLYLYDPTRRFEFSDDPTTSSRLFD